MELEYVDNAQEADEGVVMPSEARARYDERRRQKQEIFMFESSMKTKLREANKKVQAVMARVQGDYELVPPVVWHSHEGVFADMYTELLAESERPSFEQRMNEGFLEKHASKIGHHWTNVRQYYQASTARVAGATNAIVDVT